MKILFHSLLLISSSLLFSFPQCVTAQAGSIKVCVKTKTPSGAEVIVSGAYVQCWDEDLDGDDVMTSAVSTGADGCATLTYQVKTPKWYNPCTAWDCPGYTNPDIYCIVTKVGMYELFTNTMEDKGQDTRADFGTVIIYPYRTGPGSANGCGPASAWPGINQVASFITGFGDQCNNHDYCYNTCAETKLSCDNEFLNMMYSKCNKSWDTQDKTTCKTVALGMYNLVRTSIGDTAYANSRGLC